MLYVCFTISQLGRVNDAANAAATVVAVQPTNEVMTENLRYYLEEGGINAEDVVNLEMKVRKGRDILHKSNFMHD